MTELRFFVPGLPAPQGSKRHVGNGVMVESSKNLKPWRDSVIWAARNAVQVQGWVQPAAVAVFATFYLPRPKSVSVKRRPHHTVKPDLDKLLRAVFDSLTISGAIADDSQINFVTASKVYANEGAAVGVNVSVSE